MYACGIYALCEACKGLLGFHIANMTTAYRLPGARALVATHMIELC